MKSAILLKYGGGAVVSILSFLFGGMTVLLEVYLTLLGLDYISGVISSGFEGKISSKIGFKGILKKIMCCVLIAVAHLIDVVLGTQYIQIGVLYVLISNECVSILENAGRCNIKIPSVLQNAIEVLKNRGDKK